VYYDPQQPILRAIFYFKNTAFSKVLMRYEFYVFIIVHTVFVTLTTTNVVDTDGIEVPWDSVTAVQFFMTFFLTFYNKHCFARYQKLYSLCMNVVDGALLFVHELTASFVFEEVEPHRIAATKYTLSAVYIFFMGLTGGELSRKEWMEVVHKGLLSKNEMEVLAEYPGGKVHLPATRPVGEAQQLSLITLIVTNWAMQAIDEGLVLDCFWQERSQRIAHYHNRLRMFNERILRSCYEVAHMVALPIPYPYYHLTNVVMGLNLMFAACVMALFRTFLTIIPYAAIVIVFMSLREVATQLADPFGQDEVDFPVAEFLNYAFDNCICLLELFNNMDSATIRACIDSSRHFSDQQLSEPFDKDVLYRPVKKGDWYQWDKTAIIQEFDEAESALGHLRGMGKGHGELSGYEELQQLRKMRETLRVEARISGEEIKKLETSIQQSAERLGLDSQTLAHEASQAAAIQDAAQDQHALAQVPEDGLAQVARHASHRHPPTSTTDAHTSGAAASSAAAHTTSGKPATQAPMLALADAHPSTSRVEGGAAGVGNGSSRRDVEPLDLPVEAMVRRSSSSRRQRRAGDPPSPHEEDLKFDNFEEARANLRRMLDPKAPAPAPGPTDNGAARRRGRSSRSSLGPGGGGRQQGSPSPAASEAGKRDDAAQSRKDKFTDAQANLEQVMRHKDVSHRAMDGSGLRELRGGKK